jgi:soluble lytic murein transglycosylase-like protein
VHQYSTEIESKAEDKMKNILKALISLLLMAFTWAIPTAHAAIYIYQLPDGSRIISDHAMKVKGYKLVRASQTVGGVGALAASKSHQVFRSKPSYYDRLIIRMASEHALDPALVKAVMHVESHFNPYATSKKGASGLMQLMPKTAAVYGVTDIYDPVQNVSAGVQYLKHLMERYNNKHKLVLAAYNAGPKAVARYKGVPPYRETRKYVKRVMKFKRRYAVLTRSDA